jgi:hypothetical protein
VAELIYIYTTKSLAFPISFFSEDQQAQRSYVSISYESVEPVREVFQDGNQLFVTWFRDPKRTKIDLNRGGMEKQLFALYVARVKRLIERYPIDILFAMLSIRTGSVFPPRGYNIRYSNPYDPYKVYFLISNLKDRVVNEDVEVYGQIFSESGPSGVSIVSIDAYGVLIATKFPDGIPVGRGYANRNKLAEPENEKRLFENASRIYPNIIKETVVTPSRALSPPAPRALSPSASRVPSSPKVSVPSPSASRVPSSPKVSVPSPSAPRVPSSPKVSVPSPVASGRTSPSSRAPPSMEPSPSASQKGKSPSPPPVALNNPMLSPLQPVAPPQAVAPPAAGRGRGRGAGGQSRAVVF